MKEDNLNIVNAHENNLKNISLTIPKNKLVVVTGVSGSGKSSLVFDTIFKEGQRRYIASLSTYARQFIQNVDQPLVDIIDGLSPTICIDQKSVGRNPRSTVGTVSEVYDFLRLLYSRLGVPHCPNGHGPIESQSVKNIIKKLYLNNEGKLFSIMAPLVIDRKGEYRKEFEKYYHQGFTRILADNKICFLNEPPELNRYEKHTLELIVDRVSITKENQVRISEAIYKAISLAEGKVSFLDNSFVEENNLKNKFRKNGAIYFLSNIHNACRVCGVSIKELEPKLFSFNSPADFCRECQGLGYLNQFKVDYFVNDEEKGVFSGAIHVLNKDGNVLYTKTGYREIKKLFKEFKLEISTPWKNLPAELKHKILSGDESRTNGFSIKATMDFLYRKYRISFFEKYMLRESCSKCCGTGLNEIARSVTFQGKKIFELSALTIKNLYDFFQKVNPRDYQAEIWLPIIKEINERLIFLIKVGVEYLSLNRKANTLSGGESQRIRLAAQIGKGLEGCLYIFDEPSIGLHQIDNQKLIGILQVLKNNGNSLIVIEHDEETMLAADHLVEIGPLAGEFGGKVVFSNSPLNVTNEAIRNNEKSFSTIDYLIGKNKVFSHDQENDFKQHLTLKEINKFNLKNLTVTLPLNSLTVFTGVSGSGKSTLFEVIQQSWLEKNRQQQYQSLKSVANFDEIKKLVIINQKPIGRTLRSNPATYTGIWNHIRDMFTSLEEARLRNYQKGRFSFNVKGGRCEDCGGSGFNRIELHLFSPVDVVCESCSGKRFNNATLEIHYENKNIYDILDLTIEKAKEFFKNIPKLAKALELLSDIGLGYLKLGQPSPTLSGGEAQRIKLVTELIKGGRGGTLFLLDEPTTGLHFKDIECLLKILYKLKQEKNTILVIEHNLEIIKSADYLMELGPKGGEEGGKIIADGTALEVAEKRTATGKVLKEYYLRQDKKNQKHFFKLKNINELFPSSLKKKNTAKAKKKPNPQIVIEGLKKHNLKNISLNINKNEITVFTGVSGSGKSSIALDSIFAEGQRRYLESLSTYARRFLDRIPRIEVDKIENLSPTICIDQKSKTNNPRSTLGTQTEIYDHLRTLLTGLGLPHCPQCSCPLTKHTPQSVVKELQRENISPPKTLIVTAPLYSHSRKDFFFIKDLTNLASYLEIYREKGFLRFLINEKMFNINDEKITKIKASAVKSVSVVLDRVNLNQANENRLIESLELAFQLGKGIASISSDGKTYSYSQFYSCLKDNYFLMEEIIPRHFSFNHHLGSCEQCHGIGEHYGINEKLLIENFHLPFLNGAMPAHLTQFLLKIESFKVLLDEVQQQKIDLFNLPYYELTPKERKFILYGDFKFSWIGLSKFIKNLLQEERYKKNYRDWFLLMNETICDECKGGRLKKEILKITIEGHNIHELTLKKVSELLTFINKFKKKLTAREKQIAKNPLNEISFRLSKLKELGLGYLSLDRKIATLSGGEIQRIRLANQIGNKLKEVIYVLDEPTIGLHERDTERLLKVMTDLKQNKNTVLVVEHDATLIKKADNIVDVGPKAGELGGEIIYQGKNQKKFLTKTSVYPYLYGRKKIIYRNRKKVDLEKDPYLSSAKIYENNLKGIEVRLPLGKLIGISGVSGSGKSSLASWINNEMLKMIQMKKTTHLQYVNLGNTAPKIKTVCSINQDAISLNKRSIIATYMGVYDLVRDVFALTHEAKANGFNKSFFSFNSPKGSCLKCQGLGMEEIEMHFISDVDVVCEECQGQKFKKEVLKIYYQGKNIHEVLEMTFNQALDFFYQFKLLREKIKRLINAGLGYLKLGFRTSNLSGGELQRLKIAYELAFADPRSTLYILDEPTTGLHFSDIEMLFQLLEEILNQNGTLLVIEHNVDFLRSVDHLIDLGLEGGEQGGSLMAMGSPDEVKTKKMGYTAKFL